MLNEGRTAPDFELPGTDGGPPRRYRLAEHLGDGPVVLTFYPGDFAPVCTRALCELHENDLFDLVPGTDVFGVSGDGVFSHREFARQHGFGFPLLSDATGDVADRYDVRYDEPHDEYGCTTKRAVFLIDRSRTVRYAWATDDPRVNADLRVAKARLADIHEEGGSAGVDA
ncbi:MAG: redoxin domain-containing protein [Haloferacaceae archaeon]